MKDFDVQFADRVGKDQGFKILGEEFKVNPGVHPSVLIDFEESGAWSQKDVQAAIDTAVKAFLVSDPDRERWDALRAKVEDPVTYAHLRALMVYLYEVEAEVPTIAPAPSSISRERTPTSSGAATSSTEEPAS